MKNIVVAGAGFAGLTAIRALRREGCDAPITLVAPRPVMLYSPALIWVPAGTRTERDITRPLHGFLRRYDVHFVQGNVTGIDAAAKRLRTTSGVLEYDRLVAATGGQYLKQLPGIEHTFLPCEGYAPTAALTERLNSLESGTLTFGFSGNPKDPSGMRGGPLFEFLFVIDTVLRRQKRRDKFELVFFTPATEPGRRLGPEALGKLIREMERRGIRQHVGHKLKGFTGERVLTEGGDIKSDLTVFVPGMTGPSWAQDSDLPLSEGGFIRADSQCRVLGFEGNVYVAGDAGNFPGPEWMPKQGHLANIEARTVAKNLVGDLRGEERNYTFRKELVCIIDTLDNGILVFRNPSLGKVFRSRLTHWAKCVFESLYLYRYRITG
ncbi:sulfide:quinone oxidoreductase [Gammaproteobacteria bacterium]